ncbi:GNAT family N-acetyltransferase [Ensifer sp. Root31]|uniref:GNAT family N-acetyltransferase n=1 Tax=Ensifer sp. Root31 TaxID=1736512 RepID=UPI000B2355E4|nr:GNAT family N-acetyltransferase [Ensifer sp. Root31]
MTAPIIDITLEDPSKDDLRAIVTTLDAYNDAHSGMVDQPGFAVFIRDPETKAAIGGLYATDGYGWAFIRYLAIPENLRGQGLGQRLIAEAEKIARIAATSAYGSIRSNSRRGLFTKSWVLWFSASWRARRAQ